MSQAYPDIGKLKFRWGNSCDMAGFLYQFGFEHEMYLDADIGKPRYTVEKEGTNNVSGDTVFLKKSWRKVYNVHTILRQHQLDALTFACIHSDVWVYLGNGQGFRVYDMVISEPAWDDCGAFAEVDIDFSLDPVVSTSCCSNASIYPEDTDLGYSIDIAYDVTVAVGDMHEAVVPISAKSGTQLNIDWGDGVKQVFVCQEGVNLLSHSYDNSLGALPVSPFTIKIYGQIDNIYEVQATDASLGTTYGTNENIVDITIPQGCDSLNTIRLSKGIPKSGGIFGGGIDPSIVSVKKIYYQNCKLTANPYLNAFYYCKFLDDVNFYGNKLTGADVDSILVELDNKNTSTNPVRTLDLSGGTNDPPSAPGLAAKASLILKGWSVTTN
jgi:hypothetical protein